VLAATAPPEARGRGDDLGTLEEYSDVKVNVLRGKPSIVSRTGLFLELFAMNLTS